MAILNKYKEWRLKLRLVYDKYYDLILSRDQSTSVALNGKLTRKCLSSFFDFTDDNIYDVNGVHSLTVYEDAVNDGVILENIGFTGIDNGLIYFDKSAITNKEYLDIITNSSIAIPSDDKALHMNYVTGNTGAYSYDYVIHDDTDGKYISLMGGFMQGFYKLFGYDYEVLPNTIGDEWNIEFCLRPMDYELKNNTLNETHENTDGIFFYIGTRAENKFVQQYGTDLSMYDDRDYKPKYCETFKDGNMFDEELSELEEEYIEKDISLDDIELETNEGRGIGQYGYFEVETDNKFLLYNRTKTGFTVNCEPDGVVKLTGITYNDKHNMFLEMNRSKTGLTANDLEHEKYLVENGLGSLAMSDITKPYNVEKDLEGNSFALKLNGDGSIGYRYMHRECVTDENDETKKQLVVDEEYSYPGMVKKGEWNTITVKIKMMDGSLDKCGNPNGRRNMRIYIYINGYLKFVSKSLPEFIFSELDDTFDKQEGVPYNISLGGGTQGLCDSILYDYYTPFDKILPLEKNFAGTFIGDIRSFRLYTCKLQFNEIRNNHTHELTF